MTGDQQELSIEVVDSFAGLRPHEAALARLYASNPQHAPFQSLEWCRLYWECLAPADWFLQTFLVSDGAKALRGAAFMYITPSSPLRLSVLGNLPAAMSDYGGILSEPGYEAAVWQALLPALLDRGARWNALQVGKLSKNSGLLDLDSAQSPVLQHCRFPEEATIYRAELPESFDDFMAGLDSKFRSNLRRRKKRLLKDHDAVFKSVDNQGELTRVIDQFIPRQKARFAEQYKYGFFKNDDREVFFRRAAALFLEKGWLDFHYLTIDGKLGAAQFALQNGKVRYNYQIVMDPAQRIHSPGTLLMMSSIESSIENGIRIYDLGTGDFDYKQTLKAEQQTLYGCRWSRRPISSWTNQRLSDLREDLESHLWLRRWAFKLRNLRS